MAKGFRKDFIKYLPSKVVPALISLISIPIFTRIFSSEEYGNYMLVLNLVAIFTLILGWMGMSIIRFYPYYEREERLKFFLTNNIILLFVSLFITIISYILILILFKPIISEGLYTLFWIGLPLLAVSAFFSIIQNILRAKRYVNIYSFSIVWKSISTLIVGLVLVYYTDLGIKALIISSVFAMLVFLIIGYQKTFKGNIIFKLSIFEKKLATDMLMYSLPLVLVNLSAWVLSLSDRFLLELLRDSSEVGIYAATYQFSEQSIMMVATLFMIAGRPILVRIWENDGPDEARNFITMLTRYYLIVTIPIIFGLIVLSKQLTLLLFGPDFYEGFRVLPFIVIGAFLLGLQQRFQDGFILEKKTWFLFKSFLVAAIFNLGINFILIPYLGFIGAGISTILSYIILLCLMIKASRQTLKWQFPFKSLGITLVCATIMTIGIYSISFLNLSNHIYIIVSIIFSIIIYFILLIIFKEISNEELKSFKSKFS